MNVCFHNSNSAELFIKAIKYLGEKKKITDLDEYTQYVFRIPVLNSDCITDWLVKFPVNTNMYLPLLFLTLENNSFSIKKT